MPVCRFRDCKFIFNGEKEALQHVEKFHGGRFSCQNCSNKFLWEKTLQRHLAKLKCRPVKCQFPGCTVESKNSKEARKHVDNFHGGQPRCGCGNKFVSEAFLQKHRMKSNNSKCASPFNFYEANPNALIDNGNTPIHCAAVNDLTDSSNDNDRKTPIQYAADNDLTDCANDNDKKTPIHYAADNDRTEVTNCNAPVDNERTPNQVILSNSKEDKQMISPKAKRAKLDAVEETNDLDNHANENNTNYSNDPEPVPPFEGETGDFI